MDVAPDQRIPEPRLSGPRPHLEENAKMYGRQAFRLGQTRLLRAGGTSGPERFMDVPTETGSCTLAGLQKMDHMTRRETGAVLRTQGSTWISG